MLGKMIDGRIKALCEGAAQSEDSALGGPRATEPDSSLPRHGARELLSTPPKHQQQRHGGVEGRASAHLLSAWSPAAPTPRTIASAQLGFSSLPISTPASIAYRELVTLEAPSLKRNLFPATSKKTSFASPFSEKAFKVSDVAGADVASDRHDNYLHVNEDLLFGVLAHNQRLKSHLLEAEQELQVLRAREAMREQTSDTSAPRIQREYEPYGCKFDQLPSVVTWFHRSLPTKAEAKEAPPRAGQVLAGMLLLFLLLCAVLAANGIFASHQGLRGRGCREGGKERGREAGREGGGRDV